MNSKRCVDSFHFFVVGSVRWIMLVSVSLIFDRRAFVFLGDEGQHERGVVYCASGREADGAVWERRKHHIDRLDEWLHHEQGA